MFSLKDFPQNTITSDCFNENLNYNLINVSNNGCFHCRSDIFVSSLRDARNLQEYVHRRDANDSSGVPTMLFTALIDVTEVLNEVDVGSKQLSTTCVAFSAEHPRTRTSRESLLSLVGMSK